jgi:hypothetical protein
MSSISSLSLLKRNKHLLLPTSLITSRLSRLQQADST